MKHVPNKRILIVEDNVLFGEIVADIITDAGGWPIGPALNEQEALDMINYNPGAPDAVVLDLHFDGVSRNVAERLNELGIPFVFATGNKRDVPKDFQHLPVCEKPYTPSQLLASLELAFSPTTAA